MSKGEQKRQFIIEQAAILFNERGIAGTSVDEVLEVANTSKGCFYGHFESKDELAQAAVDYLLGKLNDRRNNTVSKHKTAIAKINAALDNSKNPLKSYIEGGCPIVNFSTETDDTNPAIKKKLKNMVDTAITTYANIIQEGIDNGELSNAINPVEFATRMMLSIEGGNAICRVLNSTKPMQIMIKSLKNELASYALEKE
ncbi:TetR family transcriptional regulator [Mucilaginibacter rubeus]|uniref:TetR family transcriptional regulator n=1 Tax=Mucilaginibacter rubeus TaxID=2027860 RepID=A0AAE6JD11_9SPHI|nr:MULTISPECIES: TetR/AcrR family transcriptional regulator [Mucilaginibacter]QEM03417.1 TetR family transcriptional regulator [Mucilaginibacter rubeus]QEM16032.1 TetR family transcriptional regulator [Mucilaginibacter gossypii]QTE41218.1 TetR family transcriptional regulator [Mucilaginibacter rubeus]QTE47822.1 TetR family transcriptional regulator [Mucilaginibacter rubeus]QTE59213.1 TetR family transcriptional regulator [Mucilaginibacter rubeus]